MIKVTLMTPVFNGGKYIEQLIQRVIEEINQTEKEIVVEHLVINDGSDDNGMTEKKLKSYSHLRWWSRENKGQYASMNEGLLAAKGDWICFISADDLLAQGTLKKLNHIIMKMPNIDGVWGRSKNINCDGSLYEVQPYLQKFLQFFPYIAQIPHSAIYIKKDFLIRNDLFFDEKLKFNGDYDWFMRVLRFHPTLVFCDHDFIFIRQHEEQISKTKIAEILVERERVHNDHKISKFYYGLSQFILSFLSAITRIIFQFKSNGIKGGISLIMYFIRHKLRLE